MQAAKVAGEIRGPRNHDGAGAYGERFDGWEDVKATLIANNNGPIWKIGNEIVTGFPAGAFRFPELPGNLYDRPTLLWTLDNSGPQRQRARPPIWRPSSLGRGLRLTVNREETSADLVAGVTLVNNSGTGFENAKLQLVAGDLNRVRPELQYGALDAISHVKEASAAPMQQEAFNEYHLYTLQRRTRSTTTRASK
jgi:hypothetical protein